MRRKRNFIHPDEFRALMTEDVCQTKGGQFEDVKTAYGDMSRLVVAWLAQASPDELQRIYNDFGWKKMNAQQCHNAAKAWLNEEDQGGEFDFINREVFNGVMAKHVRHVKDDNETYDDLDTAYGDMSRLIVALLAQPLSPNVESILERANCDIEKVKLCQMGARAWLNMWYPGWRPGNLHGSDKGTNE